MTAELRLVVGSVNSGVEPIDDPPPAVDAQPADTNPIPRSQPITRAMGSPSFGLFRLGDGPGACRAHQFDSYGATTVSSQHASFGLISNDASM
jgi:hypothetical protein